LKRQPARPPAAFIIQTDRRAAGRPGSRVSPPAPRVLSPITAGLPRQVRRVPVGVLEPCVPVDVLNESRESHHRAGIPLPPVGVGRVAAPTVPVRLMALPQTIRHVRALPRRGQLRHECPEYLGRAGTNGAR